MGVPLNEALRNEYEHGIATLRPGELLTGLDDTHPATGAAPSLALAQRTFVE